MENTKMIIRNKEGQEYILEYNRDSIQQLERLGFSLNSVEDKPMTMFPLMFRGAFLKNHKFIKEKDIEEIYDRIKDKNDLHNRLMQMIAECYETLLVDDTKNEGNADWEIV